MAIVKSFNGRRILKPGAYSKFKIDNTSGSDLGANDTLLLVGESSKGAPGATQGFVTYSASNLAALIAQFGSGPIVDCALAAIRPSRSPGVAGAGRIIVYKTNASTQASATLVQGAEDMFDVRDRAWGVEGNDYSVIIAAGSTANQRMISVSQLGGSTEELGENVAQSVISIEYTGDATTAVVDISGLTRSALVLETTLAGDQTDGSDDLSIPLQGKTMKQLVDLINAQPGYSASVSTVSLSQKSATELDPVSALSITTALTLRRLQIEILELLNTSDRIEASEDSQPLGGVPDVQSEQLTGGAQGASANSNFSTAFDQSLSQDYNVLLPCISRDASEDIADSGFTDAASSYTIAAVLASATSHLSLRAQTDVRKEAQGMSGIRKSTKAAAFAAIANLASENMQTCMQDVVFINSAGNAVVGHPHVQAAMCAGIRLGTEVGTPLTFKYLNALQVGHFLDPETLLEEGDFNPVLDVNEAIENGVLFTEQFANGYRIVVDNTTYGFDASFVFNRGSVVEASYFVFKTLRQVSENLFVGNKVSNGLADSIKSAIRTELRQLNKANIITSSTDAPEGFREDTFVVSVSGNTATVTLEFKPVQGLDFIFFDFTLGDIQQSA